MEQANTPFEDPSCTSTSTDFERDLGALIHSTSPQIANGDQKFVSTRDSAAHVPLIAIHESKGSDVNKHEKAKPSEQPHSEEEGKQITFHLNLEPGHPHSEDEESLVRSDCVPEEDLTHLAEEIKIIEQDPSGLEFNPQTVDEADEMGALDDFLLDNEDDDYVPPTLGNLPRRETCEINRQVTGSSVMSQESMRLIRTKGTVN